MKTSLYKLKTKGSLVYTFMFRLMKWSAVLLHAKTHSNSLQLVSLGWNKCISKAEIIMLCHRSKMFSWLPVVNTKILVLLFSKKVMWGNAWEYGHIDYTNS